MRIAVAPFYGNFVDLAGLWHQPDGPCVGDDLLEAPDAILGKGSYGILANALDAQARLGNSIESSFSQPSSSRGFSAT